MDNQANIVTMERQLSHWVSIGIVAAAALMDTVLMRHFQELKGQRPEQLVENRYQKFRQMGQFFS